MSSLMSSVRDEVVELGKVVGTLALTFAFILTVYFGGGYLIYLFAQCVKGAGT